jgi:Uma2 family endonuclease
MSRMKVMATVLSPSEQRIVLRNISWGTYERLLAEHVDRGAPRFTFDRGDLEIMSPSPEHERFNDAIRIIIDVYSEELDIEVEGLGSATFKREDLERGAEPDSCFYIQNEASVRGKTRIDLATDPPPDLIVEIDVTSPSLAKFPIYADLGILEVWRYDGNALSIHLLSGTQYVESAGSRALKQVTSAQVSQLLEDRKTQGRTAWLRKVREWARGL